MRRYRPVCCGKRWYVSRAEAERHVRLAIARGTSRPSQLKVYPCDGGRGGFHLGHRHRGQRPHRREHQQRRRARRAQMKQWLWQSIWLMYYAESGG